RTNRHHPPLDPPGEERVSFGSTFLPYLPHGQPTTRGYGKGVMRTMFTSRNLAVFFLTIGLLAGGAGWITVATLGAEAAPKAEAKPGKGPFNVEVPHISTDTTVKYDYDIVYVRTPRKGNAPHSSRWADASFPTNVDAGGDLMLLHPDGSEERLVEGGNGSITDPFVSFDGEWVYYAPFDDLRQRQGQGGAAAADIYKMHVKTRKIVRLTHQEFTPNTGAAHWAKDYRTPEPGTTTQPYAMCNLGPCPLPNGKVMFTSNRNG